MKTMTTSRSASAVQRRGRPHWIDRNAPANNAPAVGAGPLRVRMVGKFTACDAPGGGEIQQHATQRSLCELGIDARPWRPWEEPFDQLDVLHLFGSRPEFVELAQAARRHGVKVVLSPIAWFDLPAYWNEARPFPRRLLACANHLLRGVYPSIPSWRRVLYHGVDLLLPNSQAEANQLQRLFGVEQAKIRVVRNGADPKFSAATSAAFVSRFGIREFVLCAGRIEPRKNQLALLRAMQGSDVPLIVLGDVVPGHEDYYAACRGLANGNTIFLDAFKPSDPLLASAYAASSCLAVVSWFETPGLVALEAGMLGKPLVLTDRGSAKEYFGALASYVSPGDIRGIRRAVVAAVVQSPNVELTRHVTDHFSWQSIAGETSRAYAKLL